ncbi:MAG: serine protease [Bacteroidetes bacterium]|nr:serine protease [Bacteroidota bacterium]
MRNTDLFDNYLNGNLGTQETSDFESRLAADEVFANAFNEHKTLIAALKEHNEIEKLKSQMNLIHEKEFGGDAKVISINKKDSFIRHYGKTALVAASTALIVVLGTVAVLTPGVQQTSNQITELGLKLKASNEAIVEGIKEGSQKPVHAPANMEGSAFALNNAGYIITSYHIINGADSVFVENKGLERTLAKVVLTDPRLDLAVLKIDNKEVTKNWNVPFSLSGKTTDIGEKVFTLGYPRKDMVYGEGALSSLSGYSNDTTMYQVSIPVNPGNSGSPLLDDQGNVIGLIRGKVTSAEATGFAVKSIEIIRSIHDQGADSIRTSGKKPMAKGLKRSDQIKRINPYVFNILVYKND